MLERTRSVAIVGAGITGLACAERLTDAGFRVTLFDKGRAGGGRIATRRTESGLFDHGAPRMHVTRTDFAAFLDDLGGFFADREARYGAPAMRAALAPLIERHAIRQGVEIRRIARQDHGWILESKGGQVFAHFDDLVLTIPAPQARALVEPVDKTLADALLDVSMAPVWTCLVEFDHPLAGFGISDGSPILSADRMGSKPGRDDRRNAWVIHLSPALTAQYLESDRSMAAALALETFAAASGLDLPQIEYLDAHLWRYAFAERALGHPFLVSRQIGLRIGGDWTLGPRAEDGFRSGRAIADSLLSQTTVTV